MKRLLRVVTTALITLAALVTFAAPARAAGDLQAASKAGQWLVTQLEGGDHLDDGSGTMGPTADALLVLAGTEDSSFKAVADKMLAYLRTNAADYATNPGGAAKLLIVASTFGIDPTDFGGVNLVNATLAGVKADGSFGAYPGAYSSGVAMVALARAGATVSPAMTTWLLGQVGADGGFGYAAGQPSDADSTGMALMGLKAVNAPVAAATITTAAQWLTDNQAADGSWAGYVPANSTAIGGMGQLAAGQPATKALAYTAGIQLATGAFPNSGDADIVATNQAALFLAGASYLTVTWDPSWASPVVRPTPTPTTTTVKPTGTAKPTTTAKPTATAPARPTTMASATATATAKATAKATTRRPSVTPVANPNAGRPNVIPQTGTDADPAALAAALGVLALGAALVARHVRR